MKSFSLVYIVHMNSFKLRYFVFSSFVLFVIIQALFFSETWIKHTNALLNTNRSINFIINTNCTNETIIITEKLIEYINTTIIIQTDVLPPLQEALDKFDWTEYYPYEGKRWPTKLMERYQYVLVPYLEKEPVVPIKGIEVQPLLNCRNIDYSGFLTGEKRVAVPKVYDFFMLSSELDVLETRLYELNASVDKFVLLEATHTHRGVRKPLFFARNIERFRRFQDKIIHIVADFSDLYKYEDENQLNSDYWNIESTGRMYLWNNFVAALEGEQNVGDDDLLIHGDVDEIPSGDMLYHLKHCQLKQRALPARFRLTFYMHNFHWVLPQILDFPTIFNKRHIESTFCRTCGVCI
jgi:hypothetical protein